jgi:hypothetical protein
MHELARGWFDDLAGQGGEFIDPAVPEQDLAELHTETETIREWVNKEVAHYDVRRGEFGVGLTFGSLHQAIEQIHSLMNKYMQLTRSTTVADDVTMDPWQVIFRVAWGPEA